MNRRDFSLLAAAAAPLALLSTGARAQALKAGSQYIKLSKPVPTDAPAGKVEVIEFFSYNCPHCYDFEKTFEPWVKKLPAWAFFQRVPVPFVGNDVDTKQRLYYTLEAMGKLGTEHAKVFNAIHAERQPLFGDAAVLAWAQKNPDLDGAKFAQLFKSFTVVSKAKRASQLTEAYQVSGVPALGIAGRYYIDGETAGSLDKMLQVASQLLEQAHKG